MRESIERQFGIKAELIKGTGGVFEVTLNNSLIFSKKELGRFPDDNEIKNIFLKNGFKIIKDKKIKIEKS